MVIRLSNPLLDKLSNMINQVLAPGSTQSSQPQTSTPVANQEGNPRAGHGLFYQSDQPSVTIPAKAQMQAPAFFQRPIGAKWNVNSEQNHIGQQAALNTEAIRMMKQSPEEVTRLQNRKWQQTS